MRKSFYDRRVLPCLTDLAMRNKELTRYRAKMIPAARGVVLEIGGGSGLNLPYYERGAVSHLYSLDPSAALVSMARDRISRAAVPAELLLGSADEIPLVDRSVDTVVSTWTLCSIADVAAALREARRVLKPGGLLLFVEHGHAPDARVARWQERIEPLWKPLAGGCHLTRRIDHLIREAGFHIAELESKYVKGPRPFTFTYCGRALTG